MGAPRSSRGSTSRVAEEYARAEVLPIEFNCAASLHGSITRSLGSLVCGCNATGIQLSHLHLEATAPVAV